MMTAPAMRLEYNNLLSFGKLDSLKYAPKLPRTAFGTSVILTNGTVLSFITSLHVYQ
uniref:Uncharacterized protein n=1 Tax=Arundo donax TaxID=35708 RepID=A0A0A9HBT3_ARUDO